MALFSRESRTKTIPLEAFYSGLGLHMDTVPVVQLFKTDLYRAGLSQISLLMRSLPVVNFSPTFCAIIDHKEKTSLIVFFKVSFTFKKKTFKNSLLHTNLPPYI